MKTLVVPLITVTMSSCLPDPLICIGIPWAQSDTDAQLLFESYIRINKSNPDDNFGNTHYCRNIVIVIVCLIRQYILASHGPNLIRGGAVYSYILFMF